MQIDPTAVIVALIGFAGIALGVYFSKRGQERSTKSDNVAAAFTALQAEIGHLTNERDLERAARREDRVSFDAALATCNGQLHTLSEALTMLRSIVAGQVASSAAEVSEEDPHSAEAVARVQQFIDTMKQLPGGDT